LGEGKDLGKLAEELAKEQEERLEGTALSKSEKAIYSLGNLPAALTTQMIEAWLVYFYCPPTTENLPIYASLTAIGVINLIGRIVDSLADPLIGHWSDKTKSRFGRRRPFILFGSPLLAVFFFMLWFPLTKGVSMLNNIYLGVTLCIFWFLYTAVVAPYLALLPEITPYLKERINTSAWVGVNEVLGRLIAYVGAGILINRLKGGITAHFAGLSIHIPDGYKVMAGIGALITIILYLLLVWKIKETPHSEKKEVPYSLWRALGETFKNNAFVPYIVVIAVFMLSSNMLIVITPYFGTQVMGVSEEIAGYLMGILLIVALFFFPAVSWAGGKFGKKPVFTICILWFSLLIFFFPLAKLTGIQTGATKILGFVLFFIIAPPVSAMFVLQRPLLFDVMDYDEKITGFRREAMYEGAEGFCTKFALGISPVIVTQLMKFLGNTKDQPWGILLAGPLAGFFLLIALWYFWKKYPFTR